MKYLITLEPLEAYFFGGDRTFGSDNYIAYSRCFPQQSAVLGMIRKEILVKEGVLQNNKIVNEDKKNILIGKDNFSMDKNEKDYGMVHSISEVFLYNDEAYYLIKDFFEYKIEFNPVMLKKDNKLFNVKDGINEILWSNSKKENLNNVFEKIMQVGNSKKKKEDAFYKKFSYKLKKFKFAFEVETIYEMEKLNGNIVNLGAERSKFKLNVVKDYKKEINFPKKNFKYLILLSDAYIQKDTSQFAITDEISFAYKKVPDKFKKSGTWYFYKKGSVFINPSEELIKDLNSYKNLIQIGYNKYKEIK